MSNIVINSILIAVFISSVIIGTIFISVLIAHFISVGAAVYFLALSSIVSLVIIYEDYIEYKGGKNEQI